MKNSDKTKVKIENPEKEREKGKELVHKAMILIYKKQRYKTEEKVGALCFLITIGFIIRARQQSNIFFS